MVEIKRMPKISYSSLTTLRGCARKFWHYKVNKTERDPDLEDDAHPLRFGSAFHKILEDCKHGEMPPACNLLGEPSQRHDAFGFLNTLVLRAAQGEELSELDAAKLIRMAKAYIELHLKSGLKVAGVEIRVENDFCLGFVDVILVDPATGRWFICDIKTKRSLEKTLLQRLPEDPQLLSYAMQRDLIARECSLDLGLFSGFMYRVAMKPQNQEKRAKKGEKPETYNEMIQRVKDPDIYQIKAPHLPHMEEIVRQHFQNGYAEYMRLLDRPTVKPPQNFAYCEMYNKPCEYWSHCHGTLFSQGASRIEIYTQNDIKPVTFDAPEEEGETFSVEDLL